MYKKAELEVVMFDLEDVITTSDSTTGTTFGEPTQTLPSNRIEP